MYIEYHRKTAMSRGLKNPLESMGYTDCIVYYNVYPYDKEYLECFVYYCE